MGGHQVPINHNRSPSSLPCCTSMHTSKKRFPVESLQLWRSSCGGAAGGGGRSLAPGFAISLSTAFQACTCLMPFTPCQTSLSRKDLSCVCLQELRPRMLSSRLCDGKSFVAGLERTYVQLWEAHAAGMGQLDTQHAGRHMGSQNVAGQHGVMQDGGDHAYAAPATAVQGKGVTLLANSPGRVAGGCASPHAAPCNPMRPHATPCSPMQAPAAPRNPHPAPAAQPSVLQDMQNQKRHAAQQMPLSPQPLPKRH